MAVNIQLWTAYLSEKLYQKNEFLKKSFNATSFVINGAVVHIPQAGALGEPVFNPSSFPLTVTERTDVDIVYPLNSLVMPPVRIANIDRYQLSYDKMASVLGSQTGKLMDRLGTYMLYEWARQYAFAGSTTTSEVARLLTTGANTAAHMPSATGNRKKFMRADLRRASTLMDEQNIPKDGRVAIMSPKMYEQLTDDTTLTNYRINEYNIQTGTIPKLEGFELHVRPQVIGFKNETDLINLASYTADVADCDAVLLWHPEFVEFAEGNIDFFGSERNPEYLGDIYSAEVRFGGRKRYADSTGIVAIVQDIP